jgi:hypothetical protein
MFVREDWTLFRNLGTLSQKAGVPLGRLRRLVVKELTDNALDAAAPSGKISLGKTGANTYWVEDTGPGIPGSAEEIARLFSINRPLTSTKVVRLPVRGALGNGLRVVVGAVLASGGDLEVITRGVRYRLQPRDDGSTQIVSSGPAERSTNTRITVTLPEGIPEDGGELVLGQLAQQFAFAKVYEGKTSAWWYDSDSFHELLQAAGATYARELVARFDGFGESKGEKLPAGVLNTAAPSLPQLCENFDRTQSESLLKRLRECVKEVPVARLGCVGNPQDLPYAKMKGTLSVKPGRGEIEAKLPYVVEAWATALPDDREDTLVAYVNGTPIVGEIDVERRKPTHIAVFGCGLHHRVERVSARKFIVKLNVTIPYMPITTDGKEPDFSRIMHAIGKAISGATRKLKSAIRREENPKSQTELILGHIRHGVAAASGKGKYRFSIRQLYYAIRPFCLSAGHKDLAYNHFCRTITDYEAAHGDIAGMYRDPRGTLYHPHLGRSIPIGTLAVEEYERPEWTFNKILYCEKEGLTHLLISDGWPERNDCALLSSKGFASRAVRDVLDYLGETVEDLTFFCIHDADAAGGSIYQALQDATVARAARKVKIINLGLDPWEALNMSLQVEEFTTKGDRKQPVARYVQNYNDESPPPASGCDSWEEWLQGRRVELNAMTSPQFLAWLDEQMATHDRGKVVPPDAVLRRQLTSDTRDAVRRHEANRILQAAGLDRLVDEKMATLEPALGNAGLAARVRKSLADQPEHQWTVPVKDLAESLIVGDSEAVP